MEPGGEAVMKAVVKARYLAMLASLALLAGMMLLAPAAGADRPDPSAVLDPAVAAAVADSKANDTIPVIVVAPGHLDDVQAALPADVAENSLPLVGGVAAELTSDEIWALASLPFVDEILLDDPVNGVGFVDSLDITNLAIDLSSVAPPWAGGPTGDGVTVAIIDSGIDEHPDLLGDNGKMRLLAFKDFLRGRRRAYDDAGHGTFVAGLIAGNGASSLPLDQGGRAVRQYRGVAPEADIVSLKVLNKWGEGRESDVIRAIAWTIRNKERYDIRVLNVSLGGEIAGPVETDPLALAVEAAWKAGIVVVTAAGNEGEFGRGGILSPGNDPYVITVGATDTLQTPGTADDVVCSYSSLGPTLFDEFAKPDVVAPGNRNISLRVSWSWIDRVAPENRIPVSDYVPGAPAGEPPAYFKLSGTSTSAPVVSGIVAMLISADPSLTPDDIKVRLMATARDLPGTDPLQEGAGAVDVAAALLSTLHADGPALSADLGSGTTVLPADTYDRWAEYTWTKYRWTKYRWTKYRWTKYRWTKYRWTKYRWTKYRWTRYRWTTLIEGQ